MKVRHESICIVQEATQIIAQSSFVSAEDQQQFRDRGFIEREKDAERLTDDEALILDSLVKNGPAEPSTMSAGMRDALVACGYIRVVGGVLVITSAGIVALANHRRDDTPVPR